MANPLLKSDYGISGHPYVVSQDQNDAIHFALSKFNTILALQTGFGKTFVSLNIGYHILSYFNDVDIILLCPKGATTSFMKELDLMYKSTGIGYSVYTTDVDKTVGNPRYYLFNYSRLDTVPDLLDKGRRFLLVLDELHTLSNPKSGVSKKVKEIRSRCNMCVGLTGSPLLNDIEGLFHISNLVTPGKLGTLTEFRRTYIVYKDVTIYRQGKKIKVPQPVGTKNLERLRPLVKDYIITKKKQYNLKFHYCQTTMTKEEQERYKLYADGLTLESDEERLYSARLHDLQRICDGSLIEESSNAISSKELLFLQTVTPIIKKGEGLLIYTSYEDTYERLCKVIKANKKVLGYRNLYLITGKVKFKDRVKVEKELGPKDIVVVTKAGSASINLQAVNNVVFFDTPYAVVDIVQFLGRVCRTDTKYSTQNCYFIEAKGTIDTYKIMLMKHHMAIIEQVFGPDPNLPDSYEMDQSYIRKLKNSLLWKRY